jgi:hypothetical protein
MVQTDELNVETRRDTQKKYSLSKSFILLTVSAAFFVSALLLEPIMVDGDGLTHASRAIYDGFLMGMEPNHPLAPAFLRCVFLPLEAVGMRRYALRAFDIVDHLCGVAIFLLLACSIFPRFIKTSTVCVLSSLGAVLSFGVLSRASTIEVYAPALLLDIALVAFCLRADFTRIRDPVIASLLFLLAVGFHVTNTLVGPFALALVIYRTPRNRIVATLCCGALIFLFGIGVIIGMLWLGLGGAQWPPDLSAMLPQGVPQPPMGITGRSVRALYGFSRTVAYLPYYKELNVGWGCLYAGVLTSFVALVVFMASRGLVGRIHQYRSLFLLLMLLALPFVVMGLAYYPSDPERWLFLMPLVWLVIGMVWDQYTPAPDKWFTRGTSQILLALIVLGLGGYNAVVGLLPDVLANRNLAGIKKLAATTNPTDLVISPAGIRAAIYEFYLDKPLNFENLTLVSLEEKHQSHQEAMQADLCDRISQGLRTGRRVLVYNLIAEGHEKQRGYPWANLRYGYRPETFLEVLNKFDQETLVAPIPDHCGIIRLHQKEPS